MAQDWKDSLPKKRLSKRFKFSSNGTKSLGNTGTGENGRLEPSKPVAMFQTSLGPRMVHEGEDMQQLPNGDVRVIPASQSQLGQLQNQGVPGFQFGGTLQGVKNTIGGALGAVGEAQQQQARSTGMDFSRFSDLHRRASTQSGLGEGIIDPNKPPPTTAGATGVRDPNALPRQMNVGLDVGSAVTQQTPQQTVDMNQPLDQQTVGLGLDVGQPVTQQLTQSGDVGPSGDTGPSPADRAVVRGLGGLEAVAAGESPVDRAIANRTLGNLSAQQEAERMAAIQAQAQQGVTGPAAQAQQAMLGITQGSQMGQTAGQLAIGAQQRAGDALRDMVTGGVSAGHLGIAQSQETREARSAAESDLVGYFQAASTSDPNYNWRNDTGSYQKLQRLWEAEGNTGKFDAGWADSQFGISSQNPVDAFVNSLTTSDWYNNLPDTSVVGADGKVTTLGKDAIQGALPALMAAQTFGPHVGFQQNQDGSFGIIDNSTGLPFGEDPTEISASTSDYSVTDPESVSQASSILRTNFYDGVSNAGTAQWLQDNPNSTWPPSQDAWNDWSMSERTWDPSNADDVSALNEMLELNAPDVGAYDTDQLKLYLASNGGKLGSAEDFGSWLETAGSGENIRKFFTGNLAELTANDRTLLNRISDANTLLQQRPNMTDEEWQQALEDGGWSSEAELNAYVDAIPFETVSMPPLESQQYSNRTVEGRLGSPTTNGTSVAQGDYSRDGYDGTSTPHTSHILGSDEMISFANENAGKMIEIDGKQYFVNPKQPVTSTFIDAGGEFKIITEGITVYDPELGEWRVYVPYTTNGHAFPQEESEITPDKINLAADPGFYEVDDTRSGNDVFWSFYG